MKRNLMNELTEGIGVLGQLRKYQEEIEEKQKIIDEQNKEIEELKDQVNFYKEECERLDERQDFPDYLKTVIKDKDAQIKKYQEELEKIEQILGKALGYPYYIEDSETFPNATEADGVCVGVETAWSLAMLAADKIKELENRLL